MQNISNSMEEKAKTFNCTQLAMNIEKERLEMFFSVF